MNKTNTNSSCEVAKGWLSFRPLHIREKFDVRILDLNSCYLIAWYPIKSN